MPTVFASDAKKAVCEDAATKVSLELVKHEGRQFAASRFKIRQERRPVFLYRSEKQGRFGAMAFVRGRARGRVSVTACSWLRGKHQQELSATGRTQLLAERRIQCNLWPGVSPPLTPKEGFGTDNPPCPPLALRARPSRSRVPPTLAAARWALPLTLTLTLADLRREFPDKP